MLMADPPREKMSVSGIAEVPSTAAEQEPSPKSPGVGWRCLCGPKLCSRADASGEAAAAVEFLLGTFLRNDLISRV